jgi:hypothetical protein
MIETLKNVLPSRWERTKENLALLGFAITKIPLIAFTFPQIIESTDDQLVVKIALNRRTRNHLKSMYFGALAIGADLVVGGLAWNIIRKKKAPVQLVFKDFKAQFLKRPEGDVHFTCAEGKKVARMIEETLRTGERVSETLKATATVPSLTGAEPVAEFELTLSLKAHISNKT